MLYNDKHNTQTILILKYIQLAAILLSQKSSNLSVLQTTFTPDSDIFQYKLKPDLRSPNTHFFLYYIPTSEEPTL